MSKANFNSNDIDKSRSLAVKIQNSTNMPKGALIRVLPPSKYQTPPKTKYFAETHLKKTYINFTNKMVMNNTQVLMTSFPI